MSLTPTLDYNANTLGLGPGAAVTSWPDAIGTLPGGPYPLTTGAAGATYSTAAQQINGLGAVCFNGAAYLHTGNFSAGGIAQPFTIFMVVNLISTNASDLLDGGVTLGIGSSTAEWAMYANGVALYGHRVQTGVHLLEMCFNGTGSTLLVDGQEGSFGTLQGTALTAITVGAAAGGAVPSTVNVARLQVYSGVYASTDRATIRTSLMATYGITAVTDGSVVHTTVTGTEPISGEPYTILLPKAYTPGQLSPICLYYVGGSQLNTTITGDIGTVIDVDAFLANGCIVAAIGDANFWKNDANSTMMATHLDFWNFLIANYSIDTTKVFHWGVSRGGLASLLASSGFNPTVPALAVLTIDGVCSLYQWWLGIPSEVNVAYGQASGNSNYALLNATSHDPQTLPSSKYLGLRFRMYDSSQDVTVDMNLNTKLMVPILTPAAVEFTEVTLLAPHTDISHYDYAGVSAFVQRAVAASIPALPALYAPLTATVFNQAANIPIYAADEQYRSIFATLSDSPPSGQPSNLTLTGGVITFKLRLLSSTSILFTRTARISNPATFEVAYDLTPADMAILLPLAGSVPLVLHASFVVTWWGKEAAEFPLPTPIILYSSVP